MKKILWLIAAISFSFSAFAQENKREHLKCYLQLEDKSDIVHYFVNTEKVNEDFIETLTELPVFMADGVTEKKIITVYECVGIKANFRNKDATILEKNTPF
jgi:hypothetical protein